MRRDRAADTDSMTGQVCPVCERGEPLGIIAERPTTWITTGEFVPIEGYVCVVAKRHVVEPFELEPEERAAFWDDVLYAAERVAQLLKPAKMNYEIHGNTVPHLHAHIYPRRKDDRFVGGPIDHRLEYVSQEVERIREAFA